MCNLFCCFVFFVRLRISQRRKQLGAWNFTCVLAYYPDRSSPLSVKSGSRGVTGRRHYVRDEPLAAAGIQRQNTYHPPAATVGGHSELGALALLKAVWWGTRLASLLMHLFVWLAYLLQSNSASSLIIYQNTSFWTTAVHLFTKSDVFLVAQPTVSKYDVTHSTWLQPAIITQTTSSSPSPPINSWAMRSSLMSITNIIAISSTIDLVNVRNLEWHGVIIISPSEYHGACVDWQQTESTYRWDGLGSDDDHVREWVQFIPVEVHRLPSP